MGWYSYLKEFPLKPLFSSIRNEWYLSFVCWLWYALKVDAEAGEIEVVSHVCIPIPRVTWGRWGPAVLLLLGDLDKYPQQPYLWKTHHGNRKPSAYRISGCKNTNHEEEKFSFRILLFFLEFRKSSRRHSGTINHIRVYKVGCCISQSFVLFSLWGKKGAWWCITSWQTNGIYVDVATTLWCSSPVYLV